MALRESSTASFEAFSVASCLLENTKNERTGRCRGMADRRVLNGNVFPRHPLIAVVLREALNMIEVY